MSQQTPGSTVPARQGDAFIVSNTTAFKDRDTLRVAD